MPNRIIKETICTSPELNALPDEGCENLFYRLMVQCDDFGRFDGRPEIVASTCYPSRRDLPTEEIARRLAELVEAGLIRLYEAEGRPYLQMETWSKHQRIRATASKYPNPEDGHPLTVDRDSLTYDRAPPSSAAVVEVRSRESRIGSRSRDSRDADDGPQESDTGQQATTDDAESPTDASEGQHAELDWSGFEEVRDTLDRLSEAVADEGCPIEQLYDPSFWRSIEGLTEGTEVYYLDELRAYLAWWPERDPPDRHSSLKRGFRNWIKRELSPPEWRQKRAQNA